jgi:hypothetical protein
VSEAAAAPGDDEAVDLPRRSSSSRPPAPAFDLKPAGPAVDAAPPAAVEESEEAAAPLPEPLEAAPATAEGEEGASSEAAAANAAEAPSSDAQESETPMPTTRPARRRRGGVDDSLLDGSFFNVPQESLAPVVDDVREDHEEPNAPPPLTAEQRQRRARLRRGVGLGVGFAALVTLGLAAKIALTSSPAYAVRPQEQVDEAPAPVAADKPAAAPEESEPADTKSGASEKLAAESAAEGADSAEGPKTRLPAPGLSYDEVRKETLRLLTDGEFAAAIPWAQRLIQIDPTNAFGYRCLGAAHQDLGRMADARNAYSACVKYATKGNTYECSALGGVADKASGTAPGTAPAKAPR